MTAPNPHQRAANALAVAERRVIRLTDKAAGLRAALAETEHELMLAKRRRDHCAASPDLEQETPEGET